MAAFGISFPKLTLCRSVTSKSDTNNTSSLLSSSSSPSSTSGSSTSAQRTLSLSIKNVPSQPLHYDVSTTAIEKKKIPSMTTMLAIDGETKQMPKKLSVFTELQIDEKKEKDDETQLIHSQTNRESISTHLELNNLNGKAKTEQYPDLSLVISSLSLKANKDHTSSVKIPSKPDTKYNVVDIKDETRNKLREHQSNHTFTSPTSSVSEQSSSYDLNQVLSSISLDVPPLNYAIEKFLEQTNDNFFQQIEDLQMSSLTLEEPDLPIQAQISHVSTDGLNEKECVLVDTPVIFDQRYSDHIHPSDSSVFKKMKWFVSELKINRPLIYRTSSIDFQKSIPFVNSRKFSHSFDDLNQMLLFHSSKLQRDQQISKDKSGKNTSSNLSLSKSKHSLEQNLQRSTSHTSVDSHLLCTNDVLPQHDSSIADDNDDNDQLWQLPIQKISHRCTEPNDKLIRNESVKKKLFDILNDDELENACLEDMSEESEQISLVHDNQHIYHRSSSFCSSDDDARYASPANEMFAELSNGLMPLSASYQENLTMAVNKTTEQVFGRSRLITTSLNEIPSNNNAYDTNSSTETSQRPTWYTSPSPQWHMDNEQISGNRTSEQSFTVHLHRDEFTRTKCMVTTNPNEYLMKGHPCFENNQNHHQNSRKDQTKVACGLINDSTLVFPVMQDKSSNLLMFI